MMPVNLEVLISRKEQEILGSVKTDTLHKYVQRKDKIFSKYYAIEETFYYNVINKSNILKVNVYCFRFIFLDFHNKIFIRIYE